MEPKAPFKIKLITWQEWRDKVAAEVLNTAFTTDNLSATMIYSSQQAKWLAEQVVEDAQTEADLKGNELSQCEKDRLWKLVMDACK